MFKKLLKRLLGRQLTEATARGYALGYLMGQIENRNRGYILGSKMASDIEDAMARKGF